MVTAPSTGPGSLRHFPCGVFSGVLLGASSPRFLSLQAQMYMFCAWVQAGFAGSWVPTPVYFSFQVRF